MSSASGKPPFCSSWTSTDEARWRLLNERREQAKQDALKEPVRQLVVSIPYGDLTYSDLTDWLIVNCHEVTKALLPWCARSRQEGLDKETPR